MRLYIRKLNSQQCTNKSISVTMPIFKDFFEDSDVIYVKGKKSGQSGKAPFTFTRDREDPRFGGVFKEVLRAEGNGSFKIGDILVVEKAKPNYIVSLITEIDMEYETYNSLLNSNIHSEIYIDDLAEIEKNNDQEDYVKFKKLLGWFVKQLNINNNLEDGKHIAGQGYNENASIRKNYMAWRDYGDFTLDCNIVSGFQSTNSKLNYINKTDTGINIRPWFDSVTKKVISVYLDIYGEVSNESSMLIGENYCIEELGLFDEDEPNNLLKELFDKYKKLIEHEKSEWDTISEIKYKTSCLDEIKISNNETIKVARNRIFFGAPGTGKSHELDTQTKAFVGERYERVTFHPEYTHSGFFGTYKPIPNPNDPDKITYTFVSGPFLRVLTKALINANATTNPQPFVLLIEEINRANIAAVFGEVFQLLDRESDINSEFTNASKYFISPSEDVKSYLVNEFANAGIRTTKKDFEDLRIPDNMFIWASMNSADQGVFPMDTAFKRRWEFEYFDINKNEEVIGKFSFEINGEEIKWNALRKAINQHLTELRINEDKLMGPFFMGKSVFENGNNDEIVKTINNKVIMYLFEDAARQKRKDVFVKGYEKTYSQICEGFKVDGIEIFTQEIINFYKKNI